MQTLEKLKDALAEQSSLCECEGFINGFRLGVKLMAESLCGEEQNASLGVFAECSIYSIFKDLQ